MEHIQIVRSNRKSIALQVTPDEQIILRAPLRMSQQEIDEFLQQKAKWLEERLSMVRNRNAEARKQALTRKELNQLYLRARWTLPGRVEFFAKAMGVTHGPVTIRCQTARWGSCSANGNLSFNLLLMLAPPEVQDYVVVHELAHRKQMNHSAAFWAEVAAAMPDYAIHRKWLSEHGGELMARMRVMEE